MDSEVFQANTFFIGLPGTASTTVPFLMDPHSPLRIPCHSNGNSFAIGANFHIILA
jgi:hypothetical protein